MSLTTEVSVEYPSLSQTALTCQLYYATIILAPYIYKYTVHDKSRTRAVLHWSRGEGGHVPHRFTPPPPPPPPDSKASWENVALCGIHIFWFQRMDKNGRG